MNPQQDNMKRGTRPISAATLVLLLTACGGQVAREVAYDTFRLTNDYEREIDQKISAEKDFYQKQMANLRELLGGFAALEIEDTQSEDQDAAPEGQDVKSEDQDTKANKLMSSWLYGYYRTTANYDSLRAASDILHQPPERAYGLIFDFVEGGLQTNREALAEVRRKQANLSMRVVKSLQPIEKQSKRLSALNKGLTNLATASGGTLGIAEILSLAIAAMGQTEDGGQP